MPPTQARAHICGISLKTLLVKTVVFIIVAAIFGWVYAWASPRVFPKDIRAGFGYGMAHGALMPMALPSLAMGKDVDIFAANNSGRGYKLGYIVGINLCGLAFFGPVFWRPTKKRQSHQL
jgi:hypothetical protein